MGAAQVGNAIDYLEEMEAYPIPQGFRTRMSSLVDQFA